MKERGILFSGPLIPPIQRAIKIRTRRYMNPQPPTIEAVRDRSGSSYGWLSPGDEMGQTLAHWRPSGPVWAVRELMKREPSIRCPYGVPGDRLWVRETYALVWPDDCDDGFVYDSGNEDTGRPLQPQEHTVLYRSDSPEDEIPGGWPDKSEAPEGLRWKPSIFMPRWASRITLEVTGVRVERLQDITEFEAAQEGVEPEGDLMDPMEVSYVAGFRRTWDRLNGKKPGRDWKANPWVWNVEFRRVPA